MANIKQEVLKKKREAEKLRREKIWNDPKLKRVQKEKQRQWNEKKFRSGKLKLVADDRAGAQNKEERTEKGSQKYYEQKKNKGEEG